MTSEGPHQPGYPPGSEGYPPHGDTAANAGPGHVVDASMPPAMPAPSAPPGMPAPSAPPGMPAPSGPSAASGVPASASGGVAAPVPARAAVRMPAGLRIEAPAAGDPDDPATMIPGQTGSGIGGQVYGRPNAPTTYESPAGSGASDMPGSPVPSGTPPTQARSMSQGPPGTYRMPAPVMYGPPVTPDGPPVPVPHTPPATAETSRPHDPPAYGPPPKPAAPAMPAEVIEFSRPPTPLGYRQPLPQGQAPTAWPAADPPVAGPGRLPRQRSGEPEWLGDHPDAADAGPPTGARLTSVSGPPMAAPDTLAPANAGPPPVMRAPGVYGRPVEAPPAGPQPLYGGGSATTASRVDEPPRTEPIRRPDAVMPVWQEQLAAGPRPISVNGAPPGDASPRVATASAPARATTASGATAARGRGPWRAIGYAAIALLVVALGAGALYYTSQPNPPHFKVGTCVQQKGESAIEVSCTTRNAFKVDSRVADPAQCADKTQPHITLTQTDPAISVVCLRPVG